MKIVFFGTSEFAIPSLRALLGSRHEVLAVVTQPDRKKGRSLKLSPPPVKVLALEEGIPVYQPDNASGVESIAYLKKLFADLFVVISFEQILKKEILAIPRLYAVNLHGSLLPKYRGAAPTNWAIINGDKTSGVTIIRMNEAMDEGDIIVKDEVPLDAEETNITLSEKLSDLGASVLLKTIDQIEDAKEAVFTGQDPAQATYAPKLKKEDGLIDWGQGAISINRKVRGLLPWPSAYTHYEGKILKVLRTELFNASSSSGMAFKPGEIVNMVKNSGIVVHTGNGDILISHLQLEGKKVLDADSFIRGHRLAKGYKFV